MQTKAKLSGCKDKVLFTPGPLTTSGTVKLAMLRDLGSRDFEFITLIKEIREELVKIGQVTTDEYTAIPMQGSGTFGLEAVVASTIPPDGKILVIINGAYGKRVVRMAELLKIEVAALEFPENQKPDLAKVEAALKADPQISTVSMCHCETTTGIINPVKEIGALAKAAGADFFLDAMSSFGAVPIDLAQCHVDYLVSSANKCIEGSPGFSFVIARLSSLERTTPPTHSLLAFRQALAELAAEGGVEGRAARYRANYQTLVTGMRKMGFKEYLAPQDQGYIITSFRYPESANFSFEQFYQKLNKMNYVIYPGKVGNTDCFRIGSIGRIFETDVRALLASIGEIIAEMNVKLS